jgi:putative MFS transporter
METAAAQRIPASARLNRLPISSFHRQLMWILGFVFFFDMGDINTLSFAAPAILKSWHLSISTIGYLTSATFLGMFVGATFGGWFSDRVGRKKALTLTTLWFAIFSLLNALAWEPIGLFIARMLTGLGISAMTVVGITYISEIYPAKMRGSYQGWVMAIGLCGIPVTAYVARFVVPLGSWGWRLVFLWGSLGIIFPLLSRSLEESPRWFENRNRFAEADVVLDRIEARTLAEAGTLPSIFESLPEVPRRSGVLQLLSPACLSDTVTQVLMWICFTLGFYGFTSWVPTLLVAHGFSIVHSLTWSSAMSLAAVPGALIAGVVSDRWDRKWLILTVALLIAFCGLIYGLTFTSFTIIVFGFLVEMLLHTFSPLLFAYTAESFPTEIRNSGTGLAYGAGRLANVFGPLIVVFLFNHYGYTSVFIYIAMSWVLVAGIVAIFGRRSRMLA